MNYWIFIVTQRKDSSGKLWSGREILDTRLKDQFWGLGERTPNRKKLQPGDRIIFYEGNPTKAFVAEATLETGSFELTSAQKKQYDHGSSVFLTDYGVTLKNCRGFATAILAEKLLDTLTFIENKEYWYSYFQGGIRGISEVDYQAITGSHPTTLTEQIKATQDLQSESQFALEAHLEEFMYQNWKQINFGEPLILYADEEQTGRQYPAETWNIDFLCQDKNGNFVVIELKRGKTSDAVIGQVMRYIGWVKENLASAGQEVRGIVIAHEIDNALKYAAKSLPNVRVMTYEVDFRLKG